MLGVPLSIGLSLAAAVLLQSKLVRFKPLLRTALFAPVVTTLVAVAVIWRYLFHVKYGLVNYTLQAVGIDPIDWLGDPHWSMPTIIGFAAWKNFGGNMIIFIAALQAVPHDLYEAARLDGARSWAQFRHITLPSIAPTLLMVAILTTAGYFQLFAEPYVMTQGGPLQSTVSVLYLMYDEGFKWWNLGLASAVAFVLFVIIVVVSKGLIALQRRWTGEARMKRWLSSTALLWAFAALAVFPLVWMVCVSLMPAGSASSLPPPLIPHDPTLEHYQQLLGDGGLKRAFVNSLGLAVVSTFDVGELQHAGRLLVCQAALSAPRAGVRPADRGAGHPRPGGHAAAVPDAQGHGAGEHVDGRADPERWRGSSGSSSCASTRAACPTSCWRPRGWTAPASGASSGTSCCRR